MDSIRSRESLQCDGPDGAPSSPSHSICWRKQMKKIPRQYQLNAVASLFAYFSANRTGNPLLVLPTASGKSLVIAMFIRQVMEQWPGQRILMLTHVKELIAQNAERLVEDWPEAPLGIHSASLRKRDVWDPIIFAGIQSVYEKAMQLGFFNLVIIDECHLVNPKSAGMYRQFLAAMLAINPALRVIGLTATNYRTGTGDITYGDDTLFNDVAYEVTMGYMLEHKYLAPLISKKTAMQVDDSGLRVLRGKYVEKDMQSLYDQQNVTETALDEVLQYGADRRSWLIFCSGVDHAHHVAESLNARGIPTGCITGKTKNTRKDPERDRTIEAFKGGQLRALTNANVLTTGFDAPNIDLIVLLRSIHAPPLYAQVMGRGMRLLGATMEESIANGKSNCLVLDFGGTVRRLGPVDQLKAWTPAKREKGLAPTKTCPTDGCNTLLAANARQCGECGHEFEIVEGDKHEATAGSEAILSTDVDEADYNEVIDITDVLYREHRKAGKAQATMRVEYYAGFSRVAQEWVCFEHPGLPRARAVNWWAKRSPGFATPRTVAEAVAQADSIITPASITINTKGKYPEIVSYEFDKLGESVPTGQRQNGSGAGAGA
jgi:DNA repair protein RadD